MPPDETVVIAGPTGVGKTALALELAARWNAEIISADSRQVYRGLDIGTAKPTAEEQRIAPHHLMDVRDPGERFTAADFRDGCIRAAADIRSRGRTPLIVGGTPMYLHALLHGFDFGGADCDPELRARLEARAREEGPGALHDGLARLAPETAARIPPADTRRVVRALELIELTGRPTAPMKRNPSSAAPPFPVRVFLIHKPREILYASINKRAAAMYNNGIVEETRKLLGRNEPEIREFVKGIIGYSQAANLLEGRTTDVEAVEATSRETRRFAKRQMTWFRRMRTVIWLEAGARQSEGLLPLIEQYRKVGPQY